MRLLDSLGIRCELRSYDVDPDDRTAESVGKRSECPPQVFKTLVTRDDEHGVCLGVVPGAAYLNQQAESGKIGLLCPQLNERISMSDTVP